MRACSLTQSEAKRRRDLMGFDSLDIIFLPSPALPPLRDRLIFRDSVVSYTVPDNGSDFYLLNSAPLAFSHYFSDPSLSFSSLPLPEFSS